MLPSLRWYPQLVAALLLTSCHWQAPFESADPAEAWQNLRQVAFEAYRDHKYPEAEKSYKDALRQAESFGKDDPRLPLTMNDLSRVYLAQSDDAQAQSSYKAALEALAKSLPAAGFKEVTLADARLEALSGLAAIAARRKQSLEAESLYKQALSAAQQGCSAGRKRQIQFDYQHFLLQKDADVRNRGIVLSLTPDAVLSGASNFMAPEGYRHAGEAACQRRDYAEAQRLYLFAAEKARAQADVRELAAALEGLGLSCLAGDKPAEAAQAYIKATKLYEAGKFTDSEGHIFACLNSLGMAYSRMGKPAEAQGVFKAVLKRFDRASGGDTPIRAQLLENVAVTYQDQHNWSQAQEWLEKALSIREKCGGAEDPGYIQTACRLIKVYDSEQKSPKGDALLDHIAHQLGDASKRHDCRAAMALIYAGDSCLQEEELARAEKYSTIGLKLMEQFPHESDARARAWLTLGCVAHRKQKLKDATNCELKSLAAWEQSSFPSMSGIASACCELGTIYSASGQLSDAEKFLKRALAANDQAQSPDLSRRSVCEHSLAVVYQNTGRNADAEPLFKDAITNARKNQAVAAEYMLSYARFLSATGRQRQAAEMDARARAMVDNQARKTGS